MELNEIVACEILLKISRSENIFCSNHDIPIIRDVFEELLRRQFLVADDLTRYLNGYLTYSKAEATFLGLEYLVDKF